MISTIVVTLGKLAVSLIDSAEHIIGSSQSVSPFCVDWAVGIEEVEARLRAHIQQVDRGRGVLLLTDMFGGTSTNIAIDLQENDKIEVVTGVNLPMVVKAMTLPGAISVHDAALQLRDQGRKAIHIASDRL